MFPRELITIIAEYSGDYYCKHNPCVVHCTASIGIGATFNDCDWQPPDGFVKAKNEEPCGRHSILFHPPIKIVNEAFQL